MDAGGAEDVACPGCCILEASLCTSQLCLGAVHLWDLIDAPAWDSHLSWKRKPVVMLLLS